MKNLYLSAALTSLSLLGCTPADSSDPPPLLDQGHLTSDGQIEDAATTDALADMADSEPSGRDSSLTREDQGLPTPSDLGVPPEPDSGSTEARDGTVAQVDAGGPAVADAQIEFDSGAALAPDMALAQDSGAAPADMGPAQGEFRFPPCDDACCPGFPWERPGGFWSNLAGHTPDWRPMEDAPCVFGLRQDECDRITAYTLGRNRCEAHACDPCEQNLNEYRRQFRYGYDQDGNLTLESDTVRRHIDWSSPTTIRHEYDDRGLRSKTIGLYLPEEDRPRSLYLRYIHDDSGRLIREEAVDEPFRDFEPVPWVPTRISTFVYGDAGVEERLDSNGDGDTDEVILHPIGAP